MGLADVVAYDGGPAVASAAASAAVSAMLALACKAVAVVDFDEAEEEDDLRALERETASLQESLKDEDADDDDIPSASQGSKSSERYNASSSASVFLSLLSGERIVTHSSVCIVMRVVGAVGEVAAISVVVSRGHSAGKVPAR